MTGAGVLLLALRELLEHDRMPPCAGEDSDLWLSEYREDRVVAAARCCSCPLLDPCRAFAATADPPTRFGVYGAHDYTPVTRKASR